MRPAKAFMTMMGMWTHRERSQGSQARRRSYARHSGALLASSTCIKICEVGGPAVGRVAVVPKHLSRVDYEEKDGRASALHVMEQRGRAVEAVQIACKAYMVAEE